jgi:PKD repeat protein
MNRIKCLTLFVFTLVAVVQLNAQCTAQINYQNNPNGPTTFWADSLSGVNNTATFTWSFGDGTYGSGIQTSHIYTSSSPGIDSIYNVCLTLIDSLTGCSFTTCTLVTTNSDPNSNCFTQVSYIQQDSLYTFQTSNSGTAPFIYEWFVNGVASSNSSTFLLIIDTLNSVNGVTVTVNITDSTGCVSTDFTYISNANQGGCNVYATYTNQDTLYTFFASTIGGTPVSYIWYTDSTVLGYAATFTTVINSNTTAICLDVTDANGSVCTDCIYFSNNPGGGSNTCQAYFIIEPDTSFGATGLYTGYNYSTPNQPVLWNFGDGNTSTNPYPTHTYAQPGNYIVCLTIGIPNSLCYDTYCDSSFYVFKTEGGLMSQLIINSPTSLKDIETNYNLKVYPNPATNKLYIIGDSGIERVRIFNLQGQIVLEEVTPSACLNIQNIKAGVYIVEVLSGKRTIHSRIIKQ